VKIKETIERECCQQKDRRPVEGTPKKGADPEWMFCIHCGAHYKLGTERDAAGGSDTVYRRQPSPWGGPSMSILTTAAQATTRAADLRCKTCDGTGREQFADPHHGHAMSRQCLDCNGAGWKG
jgi:hypothetical protein